MMPISNYKELIQTLNWDDEKRNNERWYIFLVMNPRNLTNAGIDIIKNFSYLNVRSENVTLFLPGFSNMDGGVVPYRSNHGDEVIYEDESFGKLFFDEKGFQDTLSWLEQGSKYTYRYSEDLDLVIVKYHPLNTKSYADDLYEQNFDLQNMIVYNLDTLKRRRMNIIGFIMECRKVVKCLASVSEVRDGLDDFIHSIVGTSYSGRSTPTHEFHNNNGARPIFISYSRKNLNVVKTIISEIEQSTGLECWRDLEDIQADDEDYLDRIVEGIENCKVFIFMLSEQSQNSEYAIGELTAAMQQRKKTGIHVIILNIDNCEMGPKFTIRFSKRNAILWSDAPQKENLIKCLTKWLCLEETKHNTKKQIEEYYQLGYDYYYGHNGKPQNYTEAMRWFQIAAEQDYADAQCFLGICYGQGKGVMQDIDKGYKWMKRAAELGNANAQFYVGQCYYDDGFYIDALEWLKKAAAKGHSGAQFYVGKFLEEGRDIPQDFDKAKKWYQMAADQGYVEARKRLRELEENVVN